MELTPPQSPDSLRMTADASPTPPLGASSFPAGASSSGPGKVAPPPAEVSIRTMESDVRSLAETGGLRPVAQKVTVNETTGKEGTGTFLLTLMGILIILALAAVAVYIFFFQK